jgi:hypothetical protein
VSHDIDRLVPQEKMELFKKGNIFFTAPVSRNMP